MEKLEGKVAIVTGGAMGNGLGIVKVFLRHKAQVVILDYSNSLEESLRKLKEEYPNSVVDGYLVDIRDKEKVKTICDKVYEKYGHIDVLVNNAGVARLETFENMSDEIRDFHFDINIKGTWNVTKAALPYMKKNSSSSIVNLSSVTGPMVADSGEVAYATTKAALIGIRVNAIMPGYIHTPMVDGIAKESDSENPESVIRGIAAGIPMKRLGTIEELGELAAFLASDESSYITGQGIVIDGGSTLPETMSVGV